MKDETFSIETRYSQRKQGFIYFFRREDGLIKIGKTNDIETRFHQWQKEYDQSMTFLFAFVTPHVNAMESFILAKTKHLTPKGFKASWELRSITDDELIKILTWLRELITRNCLGKEVQFSYPKCDPTGIDASVRLKLYSSIDADIIKWMQANKETAGRTLRKAIRAEMSK